MPKLRGACWLVISAVLIGCGGEAGRASRGIAAGSAGASGSGESPGGGGAGAAENSPSGAGGSPVINDGNAGGSSGPPLVNVPDAPCGASACRHGGSCIEPASSLTCRCDAAAALSECGPVRFRSLGKLPDAYDVYWSHMSADGSTLVGVASIPNPEGARMEQPVRWTLPTGIVPLEGLPSDPSLNVGRLSVSGDGSVIAVNLGTPQGLTQSFRWQAGVVEQLPDPPLGHSARINATSGDGSVHVGEYFQGSSAVRAFRWERSTGMVDLGTLDSISHFEAKFVSADGALIVGRSGGTQAVSYDYVPFLWSAESGIVPHPWLPSGEVYDMTPDGGTVLLFDGNHWVRTRDESILIERQAGRFLSADHLSADGTLAGGASLLDGRAEPGIWTRASGVRPLQAVLDEMGISVAGWQLTQGLLLSDDGKVVAGSAGYAGTEQKWIAWLD